jgi:hypothetical protein
MFIILIGPITDLPYFYKFLWHSKMAEKLGLSSIFSEFQISWITLGSFAFYWTIAGT